MVFRILAGRSQGAGEAGGVSFILLVLLTFMGFLSFLFCPVRLLCVTRLDSIIEVRGYKLVYRSTTTATLILALLIHHHPLSAPDQTYEARIYLYPVWLN